MMHTQSVLTTPCRLPPWQCAEALASPPNLSALLTSRLPIDTTSRNSLSCAATEESLETDLADDSDEEAPADVSDDEASSSEEEEEEKENTPPHAPYKHTYRRYTDQPASNLPRNREHTAFGYLRCFLPDEVISAIATNTTQYAATKGAPPGWATTPAEI